MTSQWNGEFIDDDIVLPHNTVRQTQTNWAVGHAKAQVLAFEADAILAEGGNDLIMADVLRVGAETGRIAAALREADLGDLPWEAEDWLGDWWSHTEAL